MNPTSTRASKFIGLHPEIAGYRLIGFLGSGVSAMVFEAEAVSDGARVALKLFEDWASSEERTNRQLELRGHSCPNLVRILAGGHVSLDGQERGYLAMELVDGDDLADLVTTSLDDRRIRGLLRDLLTAAEFLHARGLAHRDIKPANARVRGDGRLVLLDTGVVKQIGVPSDLTDVEGRHLVATRRYAPPELQHRREANTPAGWEAVAVYQTGAVLYEMIQGAKLFPHVQDNPHADLVVAVNDAIPQVFRSDVGDDLLQICRRCLEKQPTRRPRLADMRKVADSPSPPPATKPDHTRVISDRRERFKTEVEERDKALARKRTAGMEVAKQAGDIVTSELQRTDLPNVVPFNGPGPDGGYGYVLHCKESLQDGIPVELRLVLVLDVDSDARARIRGLAVRGGTFTTTPVEKMAYTLRHQDPRWVTEVWNGSFDPIAVRSSVGRWLESTVTLFFEQTKPLYERRLEEEVRHREALLKQPRPLSGVSVRVHFVEQPVVFGAAGTAPFNQQQS